MSEDPFEKNLTRQPGASLPTAGDVAERRQVIPSRRVSQEDYDRLKAELEALRGQLANQPVSSIIPVDGVIHAGRFDMSLLALIYPEDVTQDELFLFAGFLKAVIKAYQLWAGDLGNAYLRLHGVLHTELANYLEVESDTLAKWMRICEKIPARIRIQELDYSIYVEVANKADKLGDRVEMVLQNAQKNDFTVNELRAYIREVLTGNRPVRRISQDNLFSKDRTPRLMAMRKDYAAALKGDTNARARMVDHLQTYQDWLTDIKKNLKLK